MSKSKQIMISLIVNADRQNSEGNHVTIRQVLKAGHMNCCLKVPIYATIKGPQAVGIRLFISFSDFSSQMI